MTLVILYVIMACLGLLQLSDKVNYPLHFCDKGIPDDKIESNRSTDAGLLSYKKIA